MQFNEENFDITLKSKIQNCFVCGNKTNYIDNYSSLPVCCEECLEEVLNKMDDLSDGDRNFYNW